MFFCFLGSNILVDFLKYTYNNKRRHLLAIINIL